MTLKQLLQRIDEELGLVPNKKRGMNSGSALDYAENVLNYKYFVWDVQKGEYVGGYEYASDARDAAKEANEGCGCQRYRVSRPGKDEAKKIKSHFVLRDHWDWQIK